MNVTAPAYAQYPYMQNFQSFQSYPLATTPFYLPRPQQGDFKVSTNNVPNDSKSNKSRDWKHFWTVVTGVAIGSFLLERLVASRK